MSTPVHPESSPVSGEATNITPSFEDKLQMFWDRNRKGLVLLAIAILIAITVKGAMDYLAGQKELSVQRDYAKATTNAQLKSFAAANDGHELTGVAWLQVADAAYATGQSADAVTGYQKAGSNLMPGSIADRAKLGLAMAQIQAGQTAEGTAGLKLVANTASAMSGVRTEAAYHLARLAHNAHQAAEVKQFSDLILQIDPTSPWAQRAMGLRTVEVATATTPDTTATAPAKADDSVIKLNLGGK